MEADYTTQKGANLPSPSPRHRNLEIAGDGTEKTLLIDADGCAGGFINLKSTGGNTPWSLDEGPGTDAPEDAFDEVQSGTTVDGVPDPIRVTSVEGGAFLLRVTPPAATTVRIIVKFH